MGWSLVADKIKEAAPFLSDLVKNPIGTIASSAIDVISNALGVDSTAEAVEAALASDPEALSKLKIAESNNRVRLEEVKLEETRAYLEDRQSARNRQTEHEKATGKSDINLYLLAWLVVAGFFGLICLLCFKALPENSDGVVFMLFGSLSTGFGQVLGYFFGSSKSSAEKTALFTLKKGA